MVGCFPSRAQGAPLTWQTAPYTIKKDVKGLDSSSGFASGPLRDLRKSHYLVLVSNSAK